jgi:peptidoglycan/LPS O-acetylase OafA/YrhL
MIPIGAPVAVVFGLLVYRWIERPITSYLGRRYRARVPRPVPLVTPELATVDA